MSGDREKALLYLLKATNKTIVNELFIYAFDNRTASSSNGHVGTALKLSEEEGENVKYF